MFIFILAILSFLFYRSSLFNYFISEDITVLFYHKWYSQLLKIDPFNNHYTPVGWLINHLLINTFGLHPFYFHLVSLIIHLLNIYLVYRLARLFFNEKAKQYISSILFAFFFGAYEVVFWFGALNNSLMVTFYILGLFSFISYVKNRKNLSYFLFQISFLLAYFVHEYALSLIPTAIVYWWLFCDKRQKVDFMKLFSIPLFVIILTSLLKALFVKIPLMVRAPSLITSIAFSVRSFVYLFIPSPFILDKVPNGGIAVIFIFLMVFLYKFTKSKLQLFSLLWALFTLCVYSFTSAPQARYYYLSAIPVILYITSVVKVKKAVSILYLLFILISGVLFIQDQKYYWSLSSTITKNVIKTVAKNHSHSNRDGVIYFVNLPDSSNDSVWKAYVFRIGLKELLVRTTALSLHNVIFLTSFTPALHTIKAPYISPEKLTTFAKDRVVFVYKEELKDVVLLR